MHPAANTAPQFYRALLLAPRYNSSFSCPSFIYRPNTSHPSLAIVPLQMSNTAWVTTQMINNPSSQTVESDIERTESNTATASWAISNTIELGYCKSNRQRRYPSNTVSPNTDLP